MNTEIQIPVGKIIGEPNEVYHAQPALSVSKIKVFRESPALYCGRFVTKTIEPPEPSPAQAFGSAADALILEGPKAFAERFYVVPAGVGRQSKEDKAIRLNLSALNPGKAAISAEDHARLLKMAGNVAHHRHAVPLIAACVPEIVWRAKGPELYLQARTDGWAEEGCELTAGAPYIVDLKTISALPDDEPEKINRQIADFWYHGQAHFYRELVANVMKFPADFRPRFFFVFVGTAEPYAVQVVELDPAGMDLARKQARDTMERILECHRTQRWPLTWNDTWQEKIPEIAMPGYYVRRETLEDKNLW